MRSGKGWLAFCPAHDDAGHRSLSINRSAKNPKHAVVNCFAGCTYSDILKSLETGQHVNGSNASVRISMKNGKSEKTGGIPDATVVVKTKIPGPKPLEWLAEYTSLDEEFLNGQNIDFSKAGKVGYYWTNSLAVKWRYYSRAQKGQWDLSGDDPPPLWPTLPESLEDSVVFISAGETDCLCLRACGVDAFALTKGEAAALSRSLFRELKSLGTKEIVYVPDADETGHRAISRIRRSAESAGLEFRTLDLETHLKASRGEKDLRSLVRRIGIDEVQAALEAEYVKAPESLASFIDMNVLATPVQWIVNPLFARGAVTLFSGQAKAGKTTFMFKVLDQMRSGGTLEGIGFRVQPGKALIFTENTKTVIALKAQQIFKGPSHHVKVIHRDNERLEDLAFEDGLELIFRDAKKFEADMIIVDTLAGLSTYEDENDAASVTKALKPFRRYATKYQIAVVLVHHLGKAGSERGSSVFLSEPDVLVRIEGDGAGTVRTLSIKNNMMLTQPDDIFFTMSEDGEYQAGVKMTDFDQVIMQMLPNSRAEAITIAELLESAELPKDRAAKNRVRRMLDKLIGLGRVGHIEGVVDKYYRIIEIRMGKKSKKEEDAE